jgi:peroxiredoxin Q/BCP
MINLNVGDKAPDFDLPGNGGARISLDKHSGKNVVVYFYPKDNTEACTLEAIDFTRLAPQFAAAGTEIIGISPDSAKKHDNFCRKHNLGIALAADEDTAVIQAYGVWAEKQMYGRTYMGVVRTTFLIDGNGRIVRIWPKVSVKSHAEDVLAAVQSLQADEAKRQP